MLRSVPFGAVSRRSSLADGERLWVERMSVGSRVFGAIGLLFSTVLATMGLSSIVADGDASGLIGVFMGVLGMRFTVSASLRPRLEARSTGVYVRNIVREYWVPWFEIQLVDADMNVTVETTSGTRIETWAVQKANIASILNRRSRVDRVAERLLKAKTAQETANEAIPVGEGVRRRYSRLPIWMTVAFVVYLIAVVLVLLFP
jgi:hypothetical protein